MKILFLTILASCLFFTAFSQNLPAIDDVKMETKEDFKTADAIALKTANYLLSTPSDPTNTSRVKATKFLLDWMVETPNFKFSSDDKMLNYFDNDMDDLLGVYLASLTSARFENRTKKADAILLIAAKKFIAYIDNGNNRASMTSELKELSQANQKNELKSFLKL